jgi:hypothetical protein
MSDVSLGTGPAIPTGPLYSASTIKKSRRPRRTKLQIAGIRDAIIDILENDHPQTVRQVFYALTVRGAILKAEIEYQQTVVRLLGDMRKAGTIPFEWIADNTRWMRKPASFTGLESCLNNTSRFYRRDLWAAMPVYVEVWVEKDALAGVMMEETEVYDVPLMVARGYASLTFLYSAATAIRAKGKPAYIYHLPFRRFRPVRPGRRPRHRDQAPPLRLQHRDPLQPTGGDARADPRMELADTPDQAERSEGKEIRQRHLGRAGCNSGPPTARPGAGMH